MIYQDVVTCVVSLAVILLVSPLIGVILGLFAGAMSRFTSRITLVEPVIVFVFGCMSFLSSEMFHLSGILSYVEFDLVVFLLEHCVGTVIAVSNCCMIANSDDSLVLCLRLLR